MLHTAELVPAAPAPDLTTIAAAAAAPLLRQEVRLWVSGTVALEPRDCPLQMREFADWGQSNLRYDSGWGERQPARYTGVDYVSARRRYFPARPHGPSMYDDALHYPPPEDS